MPESLRGKCIVRFLPLIAHTAISLQPIKKNPYSSLRVFFTAFVEDYIEICSVKNLQLL